MYFIPFNLLEINNNSILTLYNDENTVYKNLNKITFESFLKIWDNILTINTQYLQAQYI